MYAELGGGKGGEERTCQVASVGIKYSFVFVEYLIKMSVC